MSAYTVSGTWHGRDGWQPFEKRVKAPNEDVASERVYAEFGSRHGLKRAKIEIEEVQA